MRNSGIAVLDRRFVPGVVALVLLTVALNAQEPVEFADPKLKAAVEETLGVLDPTPTDMLALDRLYARGRGIINLGGLEYATSLRSLDLSRNHSS